MASNPKLIEDKKFKEELKRGIPTELRGMTWSKIISNQLRITKKLYEILLDKARYAE